MLGRLNEMRFLQHLACIRTFVVQLPSHLQLFVTPWTAAHQASLSFTISWSLLKLMSIESVMLSNHLILCHLLLLLPSIFLSIGVFSSELAVCIRCKSIADSASTSVLLMNIQGCFPLGWTGWISLLSKGLYMSSFFCLSFILPRLDLGSILLPPASVLLEGTLTCILVILVYIILWGWVKTQLCQDFQVILLPCSLYYTC